MDDIRTIFENLDNNNNDPDTVRALFRASLNERMYRKLGMEHIDVSFRLWEEGDPAAAMTGTPDDTVLDPAFDKEFFLKQFEVKNHTVTIKSLGVGKNKPVSVYIDDERWELFAGPNTAEKQVTEYIKSGMYEKALEKKAAKSAAPAPEDEKDPPAKEESLLERDVLDTLREMSILTNLKRKQRITFRDGGTLNMNCSTAKAVLAVYEALNTRANKTRFEQMVNQSRSSFQKLVSFANQQMRNNNVH